MSERYGINPVSFLLVTATAVVGATLVGHWLLEERSRVEALQTELQTTSARASELEQHAVRLSFDREEAVRERLKLLDKLDGAHTSMADLQSRLNQSTSVINDLKNEANKTRLEIHEKQTQLEVLQREVDSLRQSLDQANT